MIKSTLSLFGMKLKTSTARKAILTETFLLGILGIIFVIMRYTGRMPHELFMELFVIIIAIALLDFYSVAALLFDPEKQK